MAEVQTFPASYAQQGMWFSTQVAAEDSPIYQIGMAFRVPFALTAEQLADVLAEIVRRHETLRTALRLQDGELVQVVHKTVPLPLTVTDITGEPAGRLDELWALDTGERLDLEQAPMWRARLVRTGPGEWRVVFVAHHSILDATSIFNLRRELTELCRAAATGTPPHLPDLAIQYVDYSAWQREQLAGAHTAERLAYWRTRLAGLTGTRSLPPDYPRPATTSHAGAVLDFTIPADLSAVVRSCGRRLGGTPYMVLLAAFKALVARLSGESDVVAGTPLAGRDLPELGPLIGMFVNTVVLRTDLSGDPAFGEIVRRVRQTALEAWDQQTPFDLLVESLGPQRQHGVHPFFQLGFNYLAERGYAGSGAERSTINFSDGADLSIRTARFDLNLDLYEQDGSVIGLLEYSTDLFDEATVRAFADRYTRLLEAGARDPDTPLSQLPLVSSFVEREPAHDATTPIWERISAVADKALVSKASALSRRLPGPVALMLDEDASELAVGVLAALRAGVPFMVLSGQPSARANFLVRDAGIRAVLASTASTGSRPSFGVPVIDIHSTLPVGEEPPRTGTVAWISVTAAQRGLPKRVGVTESGLAAAVDGMRTLLRPSGTVELANGLPAELAVPALLAGLLCGATVRYGSGGLTSSIVDLSFPECPGAGFVTTVDSRGVVTAEPTPNLGVRVLGNRLEMLADGVFGELFLSGPTVALGYLDRPGPTAQRFLPDPYSGSRLFRTGLRARWRIDGRLEIPSLQGIGG
jgi:non-ribosomal peptide synthetase component F